MLRRCSIWFGLLLAVATSALAADVPAAPVCGRSCLRSFLDRYLDAVFRHDPSAAPLTATHRATENAADVPVGEAFWKLMTGYGDVQRRYFDTQTGNAAYFGHLKEGDKTDIVSVRIRISGDRIAEAEWTVAREGGFGMFESAGLARNPPPADQPLPKGQRSSRFIMISLANGYFQSLQDHDGSWVPHDEKCERVENGVKVTFRPMPGNAALSSAVAGAGVSAAAPTAAQEQLSGNCMDNFAMFKGAIAEAALRRFPLVDEAAGVVLGATVFRRPAANSNRRNLLTEYFHTRNGRLYGVWAAMHYLEPSAPWSSGWENR